MATGSAMVCRWSSFPMKGQACLGLEMRPGTKMWVGFWGEDGITSPSSPHRFSEDSFYAKHTVKVKLSCPRRTVHFTLGQGRGRKTQTVSVSKTQSEACDRRVSET